MNASLTDVFWNDGRSCGTSDKVYKDWDIYDLWANRMSNETANAIINDRGNGTSLSERAFNITSMGGAKKVYSQVPPSSSKELMGSKVGSVKARGTVTAQVKAHGVAMLRLRAQNTNDEL